MRTPTPARRSLAPALGAALLLASAAAPSHAADEVARCVEAAESAQSLRTVGRLREASSRFAACAAGPCPDVVRRDCRAWGAEVLRDLPTVVVRVVDPQGRAVPATVAIDGGAPSALEATLPLDPGPHALRVEAVGFRAEVVDVVAARGEQGRVVLVRLHAAGSDAAAAPPPSGSSSPRAAAPQLASASLVPWVLYGVAAVGVASFAALGLSAKSEADTLRASCAPRCASVDVDRVRTRAALADVALLVGVASAGVATWLLVARPTESTAVSVGARPGAFGVVWQGTL